MHFHIAFGDFVLIDLRLNSSLLEREDSEPAPEEGEPADAGLYL